MTKEQINVACKNVTSFECGVCPIEVRYVHMNLEHQVIKRFIRKLPTPGVVVKDVYTKVYGKQIVTHDYDLYLKTKEGMITLWSLPVNRQIEIMKKACMKED